MGGKMGRLAGILFGVLLAVLSLATPAALAATHADPDDVRGRFDLRQVSRTYSSREPSPRRVAHQATTYNGWTLKKCWRRGCRIFYYIDSRQAGGRDRVAYWTVKRRSGRIKPVCSGVRLPARRAR